MYFYYPRGMVIFETTIVKLKRKEAAASVCRGNLQSRGLTKGTTDGRIVGYYVSVACLVWKNVCLSCQTYHALFWVIEALDELNSSTLPSSTRTNEGCGLP